MSKNIKPTFNNTFSYLIKITIFFFKQKDVLSMNEKYHSSFSIL